jgi:hypothetical protein
MRCGGVGIVGGCSESTVLAKRTRGIIVGDVIGERVESAQRRRCGVVVGVVVGVVGLERAVRAQ